MPETKYSTEVEQTYQELMAELRVAKENSKNMNSLQQEVDSSTHSCVVNGVVYTIAKVCHTVEESDEYLDSLLKRIDEKEHAKNQI